MKLSSVLAERSLQELGGIPIDSTAWRVIRGGENYDLPIRFKQFCLETCPPIKKYSGDLLGKRFGRLTVIGFYGVQKRQNRLEGFFICRCLCGLFTIRSEYTVITASHRSKCHVCQIIDMKNSGVDEKTAIDFICNKATLKQQMEIEKKYNIHFRENKDSHWEYMKRRRLSERGSI